MTVCDLSREQLTELKQAYYYQLVDEGIFGEVVGRDYDEPSYTDLSLVNSIISDEIIIEKYKDITFSPDDFFVTARCSK